MTDKEFAVAILGLIGVGITVMTCICISLSITVNGVTNMRSEINEACREHAIAYTMEQDHYRHDYSWYAELYDSVEK